MSLCLETEKMRTLALKRIQNESWDFLDKFSFVLVPDLKFSWVILFYVNSFISSTNFKKMKRKKKKFFLLFPNNSLKAENGNSWIGLFMLDLENDRKEQKESTYIHTHIQYVCVEKYFLSSCHLYVSII